MFILFIYIYILPVHCFRCSSKISRSFVVSWIGSYRRLDIRYRIWPTYYSLSILNKISENCTPFSRIGLMDSLQKKNSSNITVSNKTFRILFHDGDSVSHLHSFAYVASVVSCMILIFVLSSFSFISVRTFIL